MQILKWASSILEKTDGDQWFSVLPKDCHTFGFSNVEGLTRTFIVAMVTFVWAKQVREKKRRNPSEERKGEAGGGKAAFNVKYGISDFKT